MDASTFMPAVAWGDRVDGPHLLAPFLYAGSMFFSEISSHSDPNAEVVFATPLTVPAVDLSQTSSRNALSPPPTGCGEPEAQAGA
jgi:hypothetical protein